MSNTSVLKEEEVHNHSEPPKNFKYLFIACVKEASPFTSPENFCIVLNTKEEVEEYRKKYLEKGFSSTFVAEVRQMSFNMSGNKVMTLNYGF